MVFSPSLDEKPRLVERQLGAPGPSKGAGASGRRRETLSGRPDPGRRGEGCARTRGGQSPGPTANSCLPAFLLFFILASFLPVGGTVKPLSPLAIAELGVASEN